VSKFERAFEAVIGHEGGYVNNPADPGGETKYGISKRSYPREDIRNMTLDRAREIYKADFWDKVRGDELFYRIGFNLFDGAVNSGVSTSVKWLQRAAGVTEDGVFGPVTMDAVNDGGSLLAARYNAHRLEYLAGLKTWPTFGRGWARRIAANLAV
jgi:lysozyme family protein